MALVVELLQTFYVLRCGADAHLGNELLQTFGIVVQMCAQCKVELL